MLWNLNSKLVDAPREAMGTRRDEIEAPSGASLDWMMNGFCDSSEEKQEKLGKITFLLLYVTRWTAIPLGT